MASTGNAVQIVKYHPKSSGSSKFEYMEEEVKKIFLADDVKDRKVAIISIAGPARKGKSLMLGYFMKYLLKSGPEKENISKWNENEPINCFQWGGGSTSITTGLWIWNKPFWTQSASGEEIAVFLMDSQGLYDKDSSLNECALIFTFSVLFSSIQVYNLMQDIQSNDLDHLEMFVNFGTFVEQGEKFQRLVFLVRDWRFLEDFDYGEKGGRQFLRNQILKKNKGENGEERHRRIPEMLEKCFDEVDCFLLPYPGEIVSTNIYDEENGKRCSYQGELKWMSPSFKEHLQSFLSFILKKEKLKPKRILNDEMTCEELARVFQDFSCRMKSETVETFLDSLQPCLKSMVSSLYEKMITRVHKYYREEIENVLKEYMEPSVLLKFHNEISKMARNIITDEYRKQFQKHLEKDIDKDMDRFFKREYENVKLKNSSKYRYTHTVSKYGRYIAGGGVGASVGGGAGLIYAKATAIRMLAPLAVGTGLGTAIGIAVIVYETRYRIYSALKNIPLPRFLERKKREHSD